MVKLLSLLISIIVSRDAEIIVLKKELKNVENSRKFYKKIADKALEDYYRELNK